MGLDEGVKVARPVSDGDPPITGAEMKLLKAAIEQGGLLDTRDHVYDPAQAYRNLAMLTQKLKDIADRFGGLERLSRGIADLADLVA
jgi:hypothetical protein